MKTYLFAIIVFLIFIFYNRLSEYMSLPYIVICTIIVTFFIVAVARINTNETSNILENNCYYRGTGGPNNCKCDAGAYGGQWCDTTVCPNKQSFNDYAQEVILKLYEKVIEKCVSYIPDTGSKDPKEGDVVCVGSNAGAPQCDKKKEVLALRDALNAFSFAWLPLTASGLKITWIELSVKDNKIVSSSKDTYDPLEPLIYYLSELYTTMGSIGDAKLAGNTPLETLLTTLQYNYERAIQILLGGSTPTSGKRLITGILAGTSGGCLITPGKPLNVDWSDYLNHKTSGKYYYDKDKKQPVNPVTGLYVPHIYDDTGNKIKKSHGRFNYLKGQFWGGSSSLGPIDSANPNLPHPHPTTASEGLYYLIDSAHTEAVNRWNGLKKASWWPAGIANSDNIDTFHEVRKSLRALVRVIISYPFVYSPLYLPISDNVRTKASISESTIKTYGDLFAADNPGTFPFLIYSNYQAPPKGGYSDWWGLSWTDWAAMRSLVIIEAFGIGTNTRTKSCGSSCMLCPDQEFSSWDACKVTGGQAVGCSESQVLKYVPPTVMENGEYSGTFCNADDWQGDLHDKMVLWQQLKDQGKIPSPGLTDLITQSSVEVNKFFVAVDMTAQIDNTMLGLCYKP